MCFEKYTIRIIDPFRLDDFLPQNFHVATVNGIIWVYRIYKIHSMRLRYNTISLRFWLLLFLSYKYRNILPSFCQPVSRFDSSLH